jgi:hypothetical protein
VRLLWQRAAGTLLQIVKEYDTVNRRVARHVPTHGGTAIDGIEKVVYDGDHVARDFVDDDGAGLTETVTITICRGMSTTVQGIRLTRARLIENCVTLLVCPMSPHSILANTVGGL